MFVCVGSCFAFPNGFSANDGGDAGGEAAQNRARRFSTKQACRKTAALGFPPPAGVAPYPLNQPLRGEVGRWPALVVLRGAAMPRLFDSDCRGWIFIAASSSRGGSLRSGHTPTGSARCASATLAYRLGAFPLAFRDGFRVS